jgi:hypothetical protein
MFFSDGKQQFKDQGKIKPKMEEIASAFFDGDTKINVMEFIDQLKSIKMPAQWASVNSWKVNHKSKVVAYIKFYEGSWYIDPFMDFNDIEFNAFIKKEKLEEFIWDNIEPCTNCLPKGQCTPGRSVNIFGKEFKNICHAPRFKDPDISEFGWIKKLLEYRKSSIADNKVPKTFYIGKNKKGELIKEHGEANFSLGYEVIMSYINHNMEKEETKRSKEFNELFQIFLKIKEDNPSINFLKLFEMGLKEYTL